MKVTILAFFKVQICLARSGNQTAMNLSAATATKDKTETACEHASVVIITAPAHPHATSLAVFPAQFFRCANAPL